MFLHHAGRLLTALLLLSVFAVLASAADWTGQIEVYATHRTVEKCIGYYWLPENTPKIRGVVVSGKIMHEKKISMDATVRAAAQEKGMAIIYFEGAIDSIFNWADNDCTVRLQGAMAEFARKSGHPEIVNAPYLTIGHSTAGIYCRNVAYWWPERVIGVIDVKTGNMQQHVYNRDASLVGVPFLAVSGEFEQYGPDGGDLKLGLRSEFSFETDKNKKNQTQWLYFRDQLLARRGRNQDNLMGIVVDRGGSHTDWRAGMNEMCAQFIRDAATLRIPAGDPDGKTLVKCNSIKATDGWLYDADIKDPKFAAAPYNDYKGDKKFALWLPGKGMADMVTDYNGKGWNTPDPTKDLPTDKRYELPALLRDNVDAPPAQLLCWTAADGKWTKADAQWLGATPDAVVWDSNYQALFNGPGGVVTVGENISTSGLQLCNGYTLELGKSTIGVNGKALLPPGTTINATYAADGKNMRGGKISINGNCFLRSAVVLKFEGDNIPDTFTCTVVENGNSAYSGHLDGTFTSVTVPTGFTAVAQDGRVIVTKVKAAL